MPPNHGNMEDLGIYRHCYGLRCCTAVTRGLGWVLRVFASVNLIKQMINRIKQGYWGTYIFP